MSTPQSTIAGEGGAFGYWRLPTANPMALFGHAPILAHPQERRDATVISPVIVNVTGTFKIRLKAEG
jgi:hypothetical protein